MTFPPLAITKHKTYTAVTGYKKINADANRSNILKCRTSMDDIIIVITIMSV